MKIKLVLFDAHQNVLPLAEADKANISLYCKSTATDTILNIPPPQGTKINY